MSRVELVVAATAAVMGIALGGCSGAMPEWMSSQPAGPQIQSLRFESDPPGADVRTARGETCQTPCSLPVPAENQAVAFAKPGFEPQTVQVIARESADQSYFSGMFGSPTRALAPNPVQVVMISEPPPPPPPRPKHHKSVSRARTAAKIAPPPAPPPISPRQPVAQPASAPFPSPDPQPASSPFPAPPPQQPASLPFPSPPPTH
jgi:hypothetical protein